jgi:hypothetical protein
MQHFVVKYLAVFDGALQGFLRRDVANGLRHERLLKKRDCR